MDNHICYKVSLCHRNDPSTEDGDFGDGRTLRMLYNTSETLRMRHILVVNTIINRHLITVTYGPEYR